MITSQTPKITKQTYYIVTRSGYVVASAKLESDSQALLFFNEYLDENVRKVYHGNFSLKTRKPSL